MREQQPLIVFFQNVPRFPVSLFHFLLDDLYDIDTTVIEASQLGTPCCRRRLYGIMCLRRHVVLQQPLSQLRSALAVEPDFMLAAREWAFCGCRSLTLSASALRYKADYERTYGF